MKTEDLFKWFKEELLPNIVSSGRFAEGNESQHLESCELEDTERGVSNFSSVPSFVKIHLRTSSGIITREVLSKFQCQNAEFRKNQFSVLLYHNEVTFYNKVVSEFEEFLNTTGHTSDILRRILPKCFYASKGDGDEEKAIVILEDLRELGYRVPESLIFLDLNHCKVAVERLAEFHSLSFALKYRGWKPLEGLKNAFVIIPPPDNPLCDEYYEVFFKRLSQRGVDYLLDKKDSKVPREYLENFRQILAPMFDIMIKSSVEPLSVICHGDFNRNNILYKYTNGEVSDAKLIDFQRCSYGSPCLDLSFFIYMNTTLEFREKHFDDLLDLYYYTLIKTTAEILNEDEGNIKKWIPFEEVVKDFERVALRAYVVISFFIPFMMENRENFEEDAASKSLEELAEENIIKGGEEASKVIADVIVDFYQRGFYR